MYKEPGVAFAVALVAHRGLLQHLRNPDTLVSYHSALLILNLEQSLPTNQVPDFSVCCTSVSGSGLQKQARGCMHEGFLLSKLARATPKGPRTTTLDTAGQGESQKHLALRWSLTLACSNEGLQSNQGSLPQGRRLMCSAFGDR